MTLPSRLPESDLQAYVDDALDDTRRLAVKAWLAAHPEDAARVGDYRALGEQWREAYAPVLREPVPEALLAELRRPAPRAPRFLWPAAAAALVLLVALAAWTLIEPHRLAGSAAAEMVLHAATAHTVYASEVHHPVESDAGDRQELLAWLSQRLHMEVQAPDLETAGLELVGGRLLPGERLPAAMLMYQGAHGERVTLYWGPEYRQEHDSGPRAAYGPRDERVYYWLDDDCGYAVVSGDLGQKQLLRIALLAYAQLEK